MVRWYHDLHEYYFPPAVKTEGTQECELDSDCEQAPFYVCRNDFVCKHKSIFPILPVELLGLIILPILVGFANVGGIGGGGLIVSLLMTFFGFNTKESISLSGSMQFVGSVVRYFYSINSKHPEKDSTHIDYGIVIVMMPLVILGAFMGVLLNVILPPIILSIVLTGVLVLLTI
jgi:uncharacterized membrane protein YfcA